MSCICLVSIVGAGVLLGVQNLTPQYASSITPEALAWAPVGVFRLTVSLRGVGLDVCDRTNSTGSGSSGGSSGGSSVAIAHAANDWSATQPMRTWFAYDALHGVCTATWECGPQCQLVTLASTSLRLVVVGRAWANLVHYSIDTPGFSIARAQPSATNAPFSASAFLLPGDVATNASALRGAEPSVVSVLLTPFNVTDVQSAQSRIAYQTVINHNAPGSIVDHDSFAYNAVGGSSVDGFSIRFDLVLNSFTVLNEGVVTSTFNLIVLIFSLRGTIIWIYAMLIPKLERWCKIHSVYGAPVVAGDVRAFWSDETIHKLHAAHKNSQAADEELRQTNARLMQFAMRVCDVLPHAGGELRALLSAPRRASLAPPPMMSLKPAPNANANANANVHRQVSLADFAGATVSPVYETFRNRDDAVDVDGNGIDQGGSSDGGGGGGGSGIEMSAIGAVVPPTLASATDSAPVYMYAPGAHVPPVEQWVEHHTDAGVPYYVSTVTGESTWTRPQRQGTRFGGDLSVGDYAFFE